MAKLLQKWKASQQGRQAVELVIPAALQRAILGFLEGEMAEARRPLEVELAEQHQAIDELAAEIENQAQALEDQAGVLTRLAGEKAATEGRVEQLVIELEVARGDASQERAASELARTEMAKAAIRMEALPRLEADLATAREQLALERQARFAAERDGAVLAAQIADLASRTREAKEEIQRLTTLLAGRQG